LGNARAAEALRGTCRVSRAGSRTDHDGGSAVPVGCIVYRDIGCRLCTEAWPPEWVLSFDGRAGDDEGAREALLTLGNAYLAWRGAAPEESAGDTRYPGFRSPVPHQPRRRLQRLAVLADHGRHRLPRASICRTACIRPRGAVSALASAVTHPALGRHDGRVGCVCLMFTGVEDPVEPDRHVPEGRQHHAHRDVHYG